MSTFEIRRLGLGGHDVGAIFQENPFQTPLNVYDAKVNGINTFDPGYIQERGLALEPFLIKQYKIQNPEIAFFNLSTDIRFTHPQFDFFHAHPDAVLQDKQTGKVIRILECKAPTILGTKWGAEGSFEVPDYIKIQCAWYCYVVDAERVDILVDSPFGLKIYTYHRDREYEAMLARGAYQFWHMHILPQIPPDPTTLADIKTLYNKSNGEIIEATDEIYNLHYELHRTTQERLRLEKLEKELQFRLRLYIRENDTCMYNGEVLSQVPERSRTGLDQTFLKENYPDVYKACLSTSQSRQLVLKIKG
jgi:predicted phage-related endonuclease